jgi:hypothetical protein
MGYTHAVAMPGRTLEADYLGIGVNAGDGGTPTGVSDPASA